MVENGTYRPEDDIRLVKNVVDDLRKTFDPDVHFAVSSTFMEVLRERAAEALGRLGVCDEEGYFEVLDGVYVYPFSKED